MDKATLSQKVKRKALELGFARVGITTADDFPEFLAAAHARSGYDKWLAGGSDSVFAQMASPRSRMSSARSIISLAYAFGSIDFPEELVDRVGRVYQSRSYTPLPDTLNGARLDLYKEYLRELGMEVCRLDGNMVICDRMAAARAGIVTFGRNNFAYAGKFGSLITLYSVIVDVELDYDEPSVRRDCPPDCRLCIDACPTHAMDEKGPLDPTRCVLMNNLVPNALQAPDVRAQMGERVHGCDACQAVCPRNRHALGQPKVTDGLLEALAVEFDLERLLFMDEEYYEVTVRPIMYNYITDLDLFRRNAAIAMGNSGNAAYLPALEQAASGAGPHGEVVSASVREAANWAIGRLHMPC